jgi:hypothetical protein
MYANRITSSSIRSLALLQAFILFQGALQLLPEQPVLPFQFLQPPEQVALTRRGHPPLR